MFVKKGSVIYVNVCPPIGGVAFLMKLSITLSVAFALAAFVLLRSVFSVSASLLAGLTCGLLSFAVLAGFRMLFRKISLRSAMGIAAGVVTGVFLYLGLVSALGSFTVQPPILAYAKTGIFVLLVLLGALVGFDKTALGATAGSFFSQPEAAAPKILDTSVIIDGRIADIAETGFLQGEVVIPKFVIQELQYIADSPDSARKTRGRRGLDIIKRMQQDIPDIKVSITDQDFGHIKDVDIKLIELSKKLNGMLVTNDYNLNKIARLDKVTVLNINQLSHALRPVVSQGETVRISLVKPGKEQSQAVGYLPDGTMVVVENASRHIGKEADVAVRSMVQTETGRTVFARLK